MALLNSPLGQEFWYLASSNPVAVFALGYSVNTYNICYVFATFDIKSFEAFHEVGHAPEREGLRNCEFVTGQG